MSMQVLENQSVDSVVVMSTIGWQDDYFMRTTNKEKFFEAVDDTDHNTRWIDNIRTNTLKVVQTDKREDIEYNAKVEENLYVGTGLTLQTEMGDYLISEVSRRSLYGSAKIEGSALGRISLDELVTILNTCFPMSNGRTLMLLRHDKIMALHTGKYCIMPVSQLIRVTEEKLRDRFGRITFREGFHSNCFTRGIWTLDDKQNDFMDQYYASRKKNDAVPLRQEQNIIPALKFSASDTAQSRVVASPVIYCVESGDCLPLVDGIAIKHVHRTGGLEGVAFYEESLDQVWAKFDKGQEVIDKLIRTEIWNPVNCFVGLCNTVNGSATMIPRKYADAARETIEMLAASESCLSAYDMYLAMGQCIRAAKKQGAAFQTIENIEESIARMLQLDWSKLDTGGVVAWRK